MDKITEIQNKIDSLFKETLNEKLYLYPYEMDETTTTNVTYVRYVRDPDQISDNAPNSAILKYDESGSTIIITWADGNRNFDNVWGDRTTLTYKPLSL